MAQPGNRRRAPRAWFALTGTPGCGKSAAAARLGPGVAVEEVAALAVRLGTARRLRHGVEVDLARTAARFRRRGPPGVVVGHLAHLLPIRNAIVLRCHPIELDGRLRASGRFSRRQRAENVAAEALDLILAEARSRRRRIWEVDTSGRSPAGVGRALGRIVAGDVPPTGPSGVDWLADPAVTEYLLRPAP